MVGRHKRTTDLNPATWPFPASGWVFVLFWLAVILLAAAELLFA